MSGPSAGRVEAGEPDRPATPSTGGVTTGTDATGGTFEVTFAFDQATDLDLAEAGEAVALGWQAEADPRARYRGLLRHDALRVPRVVRPRLRRLPGRPAGACVRTHPTVYTGKGAGPTGAIDVTWGSGHARCPQAPGDHRLRGHARSAPSTTGLDAGGVVRHRRRRSLRDGRGPDRRRDLRRRDRRPQRRRRQHAGRHARQGRARTSSRPPRRPRCGSRTRTASTPRWSPTRTATSASTSTRSSGCSTPRSTTPTTAPPRRCRARPSSRVSPTSLQIRQDTTVKWVVVDSGNIVGPAGSKFFDIVETDEPGAGDHRRGRDPGQRRGRRDLQPADATPRSTAYRVQAYNETGHASASAPR